MPDSTPPNGSTLLAVFAHPDDEAFGSGGTLARCAAAGVRVHLLCATRGESGKITDPAIPADSDVGELREGELRSACAALGIEPPVFLDFHDSGRAERTRHDDPRALMNVDEGDLEAAILPHVARLEPRVMLTFDPHGIYGHVDHLRVHRAATAAFWAAGGVASAPPQRLFYTAMAASRLRTMQAARPDSPLADLDPDLYGVGDGAFAAVVDVRPWADAKERAIRAHRSQVGPNSRVGLDGEGGAEGWRAMFEHETFTLGGLRGSFPEPPLGDLFAGL